MYKRQGVELGRRYAKGKKENIGFMSYSTGGAATLGRAAIWPKFVQFGMTVFGKGRRMTPSLKFLLLVLSNHFFFFFFFFALADEIFVKGGSRLSRLAEWR